MTRVRPPYQSQGLEEGSDALMSTQRSSARCLTNDELLQLVQGELAPALRDNALGHLDECADCQVLLAEAGAALQASSAQFVLQPTGVFSVGDEVCGRYRVERFLARGGMGEVYAVHDQMLDERVALKTLRGASPVDEKAVRRLKSEALLSRRIGHPNTCRIYEFGEHHAPDGRIVYFLIMGLVEGETLGTRLRRDGAFDADQVLVIARQVLAGLAEAHSLGILHRDLKSDNIMLRSPPTPGLVIDAVIMDFGLALHLDGDDRLTSDQHMLVGSLAYMAPEQLEAKPLTPATDIYAFGVILFEMLTGRLPFRAGTPAATALQRLRQPPPAPSLVEPKLNPAWDRVVLGCLERSVAKRLASARQVLAALDTMHDPAPLRTNARRALIIAVAVALALVALGRWRSGQPEPLRAGTANAVPAHTEVLSSLPVPAAAEPASATPPYVSEPRLEAAPALVAPPLQPRRQAARRAARAAAAPGASSDAASAAPATPAATARSPVAVAPATPAPVTSAPATPAPVTSAPAPVTPAPAAPQRRAPKGPLPIDPDLPE
jgi:serine/threonine protein kinase